MEWYFVLIIIAVILAFLLFLPFIRFALKRMSFYFRLKRACNRSGAQLYGNKSAWLFSTRKSATCDFYLEVDDLVYSVKFAESMIRRAEMVLNGSTSCIIKNYSWCVRPYAWLSVKGDAEALPSYDFKYRIPDGSRSKTVVPVMLILPLPAIIKYRVDGIELELSNGMDIGGSYTVYSGKGFLNVILSGYQ